MDKRNGQAEQETSGKVRVPAVVAFDHFGADMGDELTHIQLQAVADGSLPGDVTLLDVEIVIAIGS